ncbi:MAG TPA: transposase [Ignavibacteria bacterium]|nr:transposase [Ignavibacteria bacterium]HMR41991.1 transposase [Ignavibacteria bacterium]HMR42023.1 transposase [Ignavibacteria bacterium]
MKQNKGVTIRYSLSFKQKVISEIESGKLTAGSARKLYGIGGGQTIQKWIRKLGKLHLLNKIVRVELKDEVSRLKQLEKEKKELESALAQAHLKLIVLETVIDVAEDELGIDLKKNLKSGSLNKAGKGSKNSKEKRK